MADNKKKKMHIVFGGSLEVEVEKGYEIEDLQEYLYDYDSDQIDLEILGFFEDGKCEANLKLRITKLKEGAIYGNGAILR
jgi:hypothetical protein